MPDLVFHADAGNGSVSFGDTVAINVVSGELSAGGPMMAQHSEGAWRIGNVKLDRITCKGPVYLEVNVPGAPEKIGPYRDLVIGGNSIWSASGAVMRYSTFTKSWRLVNEEAAPLPVQLVGAAG